MVLSDRVFSILTVILDVDREALRPESSPDTLEEWDSVKHMDLILALEEEFSIQFRDEEIANLASVSELMQAITAKTGLPMS
jgi:acyl carrier protein